jgi:hypothetical protein
MTCVPRPRWLGLALTLALGGCKFAPEIASGSFACSGDGQCPPGLSCGKSGQCCAPDEATCLAGPGGAGGRGGAAGQGPRGGTGGSDAADTGPAAGDGLGALAADASTDGSRAPTRLFPGNVRLVGEDASSCTSARDRDRWCAIFRGSELWVVNVTRGMARGTATCLDTGSDADCRLLTTTAFRSDVGGSSRTGFAGDLLVYFADPQQAQDQRFRGGVYAWRPGWLAGRPLTARLSGESCDVNTLDANTVLCSEYVDDDHVDLVGGRLSPDLAPLPRLGRSVRHWSPLGSVSYSGDYLVFTLITEGKAPGLYAVPAGQAAQPQARVTLAEDAIFNATGSNGTKVYFLRGLVAGQPFPTGALVRADLPSGKNPVEIARGVQVAYALDDGTGRDVGLVTVEALDAQAEGLVRLYADPTQPLKAILLGRASMLMLDATDDLRYFYLQQTTAAGALEARILDTRSGAACVLGTTARRERLGDQFTSDGQVFWERDSGPTVAPETIVASAADCTQKGKLGRSVGAVRLLERGMVYQDDFKPDQGGTLRVLAPPGQYGIATPRSIAQQTDREFVVLSDDDGATVVYTSRDLGEGGLWAAPVAF